jgi:hypothetical protein
MADHNAALVEQFLNIPVTNGKAIVHLNSVLDDCYGKAVAVGLGIGHSGSAYRELVKATQPPQWVAWPVLTGFPDRLERHQPSAPY